MDNTVLILKKLISIPSLSGQEQSIQNYIKRYLNMLGLTPVSVKGNVLVKISGKNEKQCLIFNAHVDTVHPGDLTAWHTSPFSPQIVNGKVFGLGASDEKAAVAVLLALADHLSRQKPACDVWLMFVIKEEVDGSGTKAALAWLMQQAQYEKQAAVLGESTDLTTIEIGHKGNVFIEVTSFGDAGHGSRPQNLKRHAVLELFKAVEILTRLEKSWQQKYAHAVLGKPSIGMLTSIRAGKQTHPNRFPELCKATFDIRTTPELHKHILSQVQQALGRSYKIKPVYTAAPYGYTPQNADIVSALQKSTQAKITASSSSNDMCFFTAAHIDAVVFGPGTKTSIHKPNEYCEVGNLSKCLALYNDLIERYSVG